MINPITYFKLLPLEIREELSSLLPFNILGLLYANLDEFQVLTTRKKFCEILYTKEYILSPEELPRHRVIHKYWYYKNRLAKATELQEYFRIASKYNLTRIARNMLRKYPVKIETTDILRIIYKNRLSMLKIFIPYLTDVNKSLILLNAVIYPKIDIAIYLYKHGVRIDNALYPKYSSDDLVKRLEQYII